MKRTLFIFMIIFAAGCSQPKDNTLVLYSYDSMGWITETLTKQFESENNCSVEFVPFDSTAKMVTRLVLEKKKPNADVAIGFTPSMLVHAKKEDLLEQYKSPVLKDISDTAYIFDSENYTTPYDYGSLAVIYKGDHISGTPSTFQDLLSYKKSIIIQDPRTSSTGTDFLLWTIAAYPETWQEYWKKLKGAVLTVSPGWSESFSAFESDEAAMMVSYATDGAYSVHTYGSSAYSAFIPGNKGFIQIEGASVIKDCNSPELAKKFIDFMLTSDFQKEIPLNQWMFPVIDVALPDAFSHAVIPDQTFYIDGKTIEENLESWLSEWESIMTR